MFNANKPDSIFYPTISIILWFIGYLGFYFISPSISFLALKSGYLISATSSSCLILLLFFTIASRTFKPIQLLILTVLAAILVYSGYHYPGIISLRFLCIDFGLILFSIVISSLLVQSLHQPSYLILIAVLGAALDLWSGFIGPTKGLIASGEVDYFLYRFPLLGTAKIPGFFGVSDLIFTAFFLFASVKFGFNRIRNLIILQLAFIGIFIMVIATEVAIPALPFLSLGFIFINWKDLEKQTKPGELMASFFIRKRPWLFSLMLVILLISVPLLKWYSRYQIQQKIETIDSQANNSIDFAIQRYNQIIASQQMALSLISHRDISAPLASRFDPALSQISTLQPKTQFYLLAVTKDWNYTILDQWQPDSTRTPAGIRQGLIPDWHLVLTQLQKHNLNGQDTGTIVIPTDGLQILTYTRLPKLQHKQVRLSQPLLESGRGKSESVKYLFAYFPFTATWLKKTSETTSPTQPAVDFAIISRTTEPTASDEWNTIDASMNLRQDGFPRFTDRELNLSYLDRTKYFFYQHIEEAPYKICGFAVPYTKTDCLLSAIIRYPVEEISQIENYTQVSTSIIFLLATIMVVSLVLHRGLKLTKKFVFALALATLLP
ncbi:MAG: hypothetical protein QME64_00990, partial [bacterium]|nr:hypothetical protein [bacterium]